MIRLFIENIEIELDKSVEFAITKQWEDLTNPTTIINDWSKTVEIPFTQKNNQTFGNIYNVDTKKLSGDYKLMRLYFDPLKKLDFRLEYNNSVLMTGYAKMNTITKKDGKGTYNITLNGSLGKVLQEMQKITFDAEKYVSGTTEYDKYYIKPSESFGEAIINKELVCDCWTGNTIDTTLQWIGFAPNNSFNDNFDYKTYQLTNTQTQSFETTLENRSAFTQTGIKASSVIGNGLLPKNFGEYRSYLQLPYIKFPKLFNMFKNKVESTTGYQFELDGSWFNQYNTLWGNEVMMLQNFKQKDNNELTFTLNGPGPTGHLINAVDYQTSANRTDFPDTGNIEHMFSLASANAGDFYNVVEHKFISDKNLSVNIKGNFYVDFQFCFDSSYIGTSVSFGTTNGILITLFTSDNQTLAKIAFYGPNSTVTGNVTHKIVIPYKAITQQNYSSLHIYTGNINIDTKYILKNNQTIYYKVHFINTTSDPTCIFRKQNGAAALPSYCIFQSRFLNNTNFLYSKIFSRSESQFTLNDLWNNDVLPYDVILNYCKMHHILIQVDDDNKKIKFIPAWKYFYNYTIEDWTDKLDMSKDYIITPCSFENKYVLFNYKDNETKLGKEYLDKYGFDFGEMNLVTEYNFNTETKKLFDKEINTSMVYSDNNMSWNDLYAGIIRYVIPQDTLVYSKDEDDKYVSNFGAFYTYKGVVNFDNNLLFNFRQATISDDTELMIKNNTYCYSQGIGTSTINVNSYPLLDIVSGDTMCIYSKPKYNYTYDTHSYDDVEGIYQKLWHNYLDERYNSNNKKLTCYLNIKPIDYINFSFNKFIKIENQLYFVNKIYDYSINDTTSTKVDLIQVTDVENYSNVYFIKPDVNSMSIASGGTKFINVLSNINYTSNIISSGSADCEIIPNIATTKGNHRIYIKKHTSSTNVNNLSLHNDVLELQQTIPINFDSGAVPYSVSPSVDPYDPYYVFDSENRTKTLIITSNQDWTYLETLNEWDGQTLNVSINPTSGTAGNTSITITINSASEDAVGSICLGNLTTKDAITLPIAIDGVI